MNKSNNYWTRRKAEFVVQKMDEAEKAAAIMKVVYAKASKYLTEQAERIFNRYQRDYGLSETQARNLIKRSGVDVLKMKQELKNGVQTEEVKQLLDDMDSAAYASRIEQLVKSQQDIDSLMQLMTKNDIKQVTKHLTNIADDTYLNTMFLLQKQAGVSFGFHALDPDYIDKMMKINWSGEHFSERIWKNHEALGQTLKEEYLVNYLTGRTDDEMAKVIAEKFGVEGYKARRLVRTESAFFMGEIEAQAYEEAEIKEYEYVSVLDNRTTPICQQHDGKIYKVSERKPGVNYPPLHVFCRATTVAYFSEEWLSDKEVLEDAENMNFDDFKGEFYKRSSNNFEFPDDPIRELMGSMFDSHPKEAEELIDKLRGMGVEVEFKSGKGMVYTPGDNTKGFPGRIKIDKNASYSALLHEARHAFDDYENGRPGMAFYVQNPQKVWEMEKNAYLVELDFYKEYNTPRKYIRQIKKLSKDEQKRLGF